jgi:hypothetical protein
VPRNRPSARAKRRSRLAAASVILIVAAVIGYLAVGHAPPTLVRPTACVAGPGTQGVELTPGQAGIAATIAGVAARREMPARAVAIAYATALQESDLADLDYGDRDSVGIFQQRPSEGWGTTRQIENPVYATTRFFAALAQVPHYRRLRISKAAQDVQHSADGSAYGQYAATGTDMASAFTGALPHAVWCSYGSPVGKARLKAARKALASAFGPLAARVSSDPQVSVQVASTHEGWAVAAWLVTNAAVYGISDVHYQGYGWTSGSATGHWARLRAGTRVQAAPAVVVFG